MLIYLNEVCEKVEANSVDSISISSSSFHVTCDSDPDRHRAFSFRVPANLRLHVTALNASINFPLSAPSKLLPSTPPPILHPPPQRTIHMEGKYSMREDQIVEAARREEAAQAVKKPTTILDFPREVRLRIYGHVFDSLNSNPTISRLATFPVLPFMRANRTLRAEAWEPWFAHLDSAIAADERLLRWIMWERQRMDHLSRTHPVTEIDTDRRRLCIGRNRCVATLVIDRIGKSKTLRAMREFMESGIELAVGTPERFWREGVPPPRPVTVTEVSAICVLLSRFSN